MQHQSHYYSKMFKAQPSLRSIPLIRLSNRFSQTMKVWPYLHSLGVEVWSYLHSLGVEVWSYLHSLGVEVWSYLHSLGGKVWKCWMKKNVIPNRRARASRGFPAHPSGFPSGSALGESLGMGWKTQTHPRSSVRYISYQVTTIQTKVVIFVFKA